MSLLLLTACGGQSTEPVGKIDTDTPQVEQPDTTPDEVETPNEAETPDEADDEIVYLVDVPVPQMTGDADHYAETIDAPSQADYQTMYRVEDDRAAGELETYIAALEAAGFTFDVSGSEKTDEDYVYTARATKNNACVKIDFEWHASDLRSEGDLVIRNAHFHVFIDVGDAGEKPQSLDELAAQLPALPEGNWGRDDSEDEHWIRCEFYCDQLSLEDAKAYADALEAAGYGRNVVRDENGEDFTFEGYGSGAQLTMVTVLRGEGYVSIILQMARN